jgi:hypothetical protein
LPVRDTARPTKIEPTLNRLGEQESKHHGSADSMDFPENHKVPAFAKAAAAAIDTPISPSGKYRGKDNPVA